MTSSDLNDATDSQVGSGASTSSADGVPRPTAARALAWEALGLVAVALVGLALIGGLLLLVRAKLAVLEEERKEAAAAREEPVTPVIVRHLKSRTVVDRVRLPGMIQAWAEIEVAAEVAGKVVRTNATPIEDGTLVDANKPILHIDPSDYEIARKRAEAELVLAHQTFSRTDNLVREHVKTPSDLDRDRTALQRAEAQAAAVRLALARCTIRSPVAGLVDDVLPEVGEYVRPGAAVAHLLQLDPVKVEVGVPEKDVAALRRLTRRRAKVAVTIDAIRKGYTVEATCIYLSRKPLREALVYRLRLRLPNADGLLQPGMFVKADIVRAERPGSLIVPLFAVLAKDEERFVYVVEAAEDGEAEAGALSEDASASLVARRRPVELGIMQGREVEIVSGLKAGDRLVVMGQRSVSDGSPVTVTRTAGDLSEFLR